MALALPNSAFALRVQAGLENDVADQLARDLDPENSRSTADSASAAGPSAPLKAGLEGVETGQTLQFKTVQALRDFLVQGRFERISHPEKAGGTHFDTYLYPKISLVEKVAKGKAVMKSVALARNRMGGLVTGFVVDETEESQRLFAESVPSLKGVLEQRVAVKDLDGAKKLIEKLFETTLRIIRRGVLSWDSKVENFGVTPAGEVVLLDLGGLVDAESALGEPDAEESSLEFFYLKMNEGIPPALVSYYHELKDRFGFANGSAIARTVEANKGIEAPLPVDWKPTVVVPAAGLEGLMELNKWSGLPNLDTLGSNLYPGRGRDVRRLPNHKVPDDNLSGPVSIPIAVKAFGVFEDLNLPILVGLHGGKPLYTMNLIQDASGDFQIDLGTAVPADSRFVSIEEGGEIIIGREKKEGTEVTHAVPNDFISGLHLAIVKIGDVIFLRDLGSSNRTYLLEGDVKGATRLAAYAKPAASPPAPVVRPESVSSESEGGTVDARLLPGMVDQFATLSLSPREEDLAQLPQELRRGRFFTVQLFKEWLAAHKENFANYLEDRLATLRGNVILLMRDIASDDRQNSALALLIKEVISELPSNPPGFAEGPSVGDALVNLGLWLAGAVPQGSQSAGLEENPRLLQLIAVADDVQHQMDRHPKTEQIAGIIQTAFDRFEQGKESWHPGQRISIDDFLYIVFVREGIPLDEMLGMRLFSKEDEHPVPRIAILPRLLGQIKRKIEAVQPTQINVDDVVLQVAQEAGRASLPVDELRALADRVLEKIFPVSAAGLEGQIERKLFEAAASTFENGEILSADQFEERFSQRMSDQQKLRFRHMVEDGFKEFGVVEVPSRFYVHADTELARIANTQVGLVPKEAVTFIVSGDLRKRSHAEGFFPGPGVIFWDISLPERFEWPESPLAVHGLNIGQMAVLWPNAWIALSINRSLTPEQVLHLRMMTVQDSDGRTFLVFA